MELSRKEFRFAERSGSVAGVHHASSCAIWQSEKEATLFVTHDIEEAIQLAHLVLATSAGPATIPGRGGVDLSEPATSIRIFRVMGMSLRVGEAAAA